jgi:branched-chain amino acid transport system ATP-binding protein
MSALLAVSQLSVAYGGIQAVRELSLEVAPGEMVCLIGANGAGKTSTLKAISGLIALQAGSVQFDGQAIARLPPHEVARRGLALVPEGRGVFPRMSVAENLMMGAYTRHDRAAIARDLDQVHALLPRLTERRAQLAGLLSGGEQQMLAIARSLVSRPKLLLIDEMSLGLMPVLVAMLFKLIQDLCRKNISILLIEQNAKKALEIAHRGYLIENGRVVLEGQASALLQNDKVKAAYLGG